MLMHFNISPHMPMVILDFAHIRKYYVLYYLSLKKDHFFNICCDVIYKFVTHVYDFHGKVHWGTSIIVIGTHLIN